MSDNKAHNSSIIVTHGGRMRCLRDLVFLAAGIDPPRKRFKYCAILELLLHRDSATFRIIFPGYGIKSDVTDKAEILKEKVKYYYNENEIHVELNQIMTATLIRSLGLIDGDVVQKRRFFIVRHGYGYHNQAKGSIRKYFLADPELTKEADNLYEAGEQMACRASKVLGEYILEKNIPPLKWFFSSDLKRAKRTVSLIHQQFHTDFQNSREIRELIRVSAPEWCVLPCSHEIHYSDDQGRCDGNKLMTLENYSSCTDASFHLGRCLTVGVQFNETFNLAFHNGHVRSQVNGGNCSLTTMIAMAVCYSDHKQENLNVMDWIVILQRFIHLRHRSQISKKRICTRRIWSSRYKTLRS